MIKKLQNSLIFNLVTSCLLLFITVSPCLCLSQENTSNGTIGEVAASAHDCCDKSSKEDNSAKSGCDTCENCVALSNDCSNDLSYLSINEGSINASGDNIPVSLVSSLHRINFDVLYASFNSYFSPPDFLTKSPISLNLLLNRWLI